MIKSGFLFKIKSTSESSSSFTIITIAFLSKSSRIDCTCGKINLFFGAAMSCGITSRTKSFSLTIPSKSFSSFFGLNFKSSSKNISKPIFSVAETSTTGKSIKFSLIFFISSSRKLSILFINIITGVSLNFFISSFSFELSVSATTTTAISVFKITSSVLFSLFSPSSVVSVMPAVSIKRQGPKDFISMDLYTGSVVVPSLFDTMEMSLFAKAFIIELFPAFTFPKKPMWILFPELVLLSSIKI